MFRADISTSATRTFASFCSTIHGGSSDGAHGAMLLGGAGDARRRDVAVVDADRGACASAGGARRFKPLHPPSRRAAAGVVGVVGGGVGALSGGGGTSTRGRPS